MSVYRREWDCCGSVTEWEPEHCPFCTPDQQPAAVLSDLIGLAISVDVSTGDDDATHRYFGKVDAVQECDGEKNWIILLVQEPKANFAIAAQQPAGELPVLPDHPESQMYRWSEAEKKAIRQYGRLCATRQPAPVASENAAKLPNGVAATNVYDAYKQGRAAGIEEAAKACDRIAQHNSDNGKTELVWECIAVINSIAAPSEQVKI